VFIQTQDTPNPNTLKFIPGRVISDQEGVNFSTPEEAAYGTQLASQLFEIDGVTNVYIHKDFISITKEDAKSWDPLKTFVLACLIDYFVLHEKVEFVGKKTTPPDDTAPSDDISKEIKDLIDSRVRPAVAMDGGDITFERFSQGVVYLKLKGACSGCPSSSLTLKDGIENMLKYYIPEVEFVEAVPTTD